MPNVIQLTNESFEKEVLNSDMPVLVDFWAPWCMPCIMAAPILDELSKEFDGRIKIAKLNIEEANNRNLAMRYSIQSIPNMKIFKEGKVVEEIVGLRPKEDFVRILEGVLAPQ